MTESGGLETTWRVLASTPNETAVDVLLAALDNPRQAIAFGALGALLDRRTPRGMTELLRRWDRFSASWKEVLAARSDRLIGALRDALVGDDAALLANACDATLWLREYELLPVLIHVAEAVGRPGADLAAATLLRLAELLHDELGLPRNSTRRRDPTIARTRIVAALEKSLQRWSLHQRAEIAEAFLLLCSRDNAALKQILSNPHEAVFLKILELLGQSRQPGILRLLVSFLDDRRAPSAALHTLARRSDKPFLARLVKKVGYEPSGAARRNLKLIRDFPWLRTDPTRLDALDDAGQHAVVQIVTASAMKRDDVLPLLAYLMQRGRPGGRRAAAEALRHFQGAEANRLVLAALKDGDPLVQAAALTHVRQRGLPGVMSHLLELLESGHETVRAAARKCLADFSCKRFLAAFDTLTPEARQSTGSLVGRIDPQTVPTLREELASPSRTRRMRAIEAAAVVGAAPALEDVLLQMLEEDDQFLRAKAAETLRHCDSDRVRQALRERLLDSHVSVQLAAEASLTHLSRHRDNNVPSGTMPPVIQETPPLLSSPLEPK